MTERHSPVQSDFDKHKEKGFSFGAPREVYKRVFNKTQAMLCSDPEVPGPGYYNVKTFVEKIVNDNRKVIMGRRPTYEFRKANVFFTFFSFIIPLIPWTRLLRRSKLIFKQHRFLL